MIEEAAAKGHFEVVQRVHSRSLEQVQDGGATSVLEDARASNAFPFALHRNHLQVVEYLYASGYVGSTIDLTHFYRDDFGGLSFEMQQWLLNHSFRDCLETFAHYRAVINGNLAIVQWLHTNNVESFGTGTMDCAAEHGQLDVVKWLHENRREGCTTQAMDLAVERGHLDIIKWLHLNRFEGCTGSAMDGAALYGHLAVAQWLHTHREEG
uniref:Ankyrin repeat-containing domain n=1 Tax=Globisporangium ultimum (strain ATCC 200006 / CBS 805.95 / DAOM BR144) TaxID=431595 RepID=K3WZX3_GLOUD